MTKAVGVKEDGTLTQQAVAKIEKMASERKTQAVIAAALGMTFADFKQQLDKNKGRNPARMAYEAGRAVVEQSMVDAMYHEAMGFTTFEEYTVSEAELEQMTEALRERVPADRKIVLAKRTISKAAATTAIWFTKTQFGWSEKEAQGPQQSNVQIVLPASMTREQYYGMFGLKGPVEQPKIAPPKNVHATMLQQPRNAK